MAFRSLLLLSCLLVIGARAAGQRELTDAQYYDKVRGAWLGKCIGGALGMPIEGWRQPDIAKKYPRITDYLGYFDDAFAGWSGVACSVQVPRDGEWHRIRAILDVPPFDSALYAVPIIGMTFEFSATPASWEIRDLRILRPRNDLRFDASNWKTGERCTWLDERRVRFDFDGTRSWLRLANERARSLALGPADRVLLSFDARWISGDNRVALAFDYRAKGRLQGFGPDDDTTYQIIGLHALETYGPDLTSEQIGREWREHLCCLPINLAEGLALERLNKGIMPPDSGQHAIGEAIGGQMKGEIWGLVCPGRPDMAAEYARRDGVVAHCRNGVYGEQFVAAMISGAFRESDVLKLIDLGLSFIPPDSEYAGVVKEVIGWHKEYPDYRDTLRRIVAKYPGICDPVYAEAGIVTLALLYGEDDFEKTITIAASCGNDTDCNTATVGALLGCIIGAKAIPSRWKAPIGDEFRCFAKGLERWKISELAKRICAAGRRMGSPSPSSTKQSL